MRTSLDNVHCSIARTMDILGDGWTVLILRDVFAGLTRFEQFHEDLGVSRKILSARLEHLVDAGVLERKVYSEHPPRYDYLPTPKGAELFAVIAAMMAWGDRWAAGSAGPPALLRHLTCGHTSVAVVSCDTCGEPLTLQETLPEPGPGGRQGQGTMLLAPLLAGGASGT